MPAVPVCAESPTYHLRSCFHLSITVNIIKTIVGRADER